MNINNSLSAKARIRGLGWMAPLVVVTAMVLGVNSSAFGAGKTGTTLAASKTIDICEVPSRSPVT